MSTVERLLKATEDIWAGYHDKPFVRGLGDGTLDVKKFRRYIIQDYWYLMDYTKVFAVGVAKSHSVEVMKLFAKYIQAILDGEVNVHNGYMADFGITQEELAAALSVSRQTIGSLENGRYNPSLILAFKIARYFDMRIEQIFIDEEAVK